MNFPAVKKEIAKPGHVKAGQRRHGRRQWETLKGMAWRDWHIQVCMATPLDCGPATGGKKWLPVLAHGFLISHSLKLYQFANCVKELQESSRENFPISQNFRFDSRSLVRSSAFRDVFLRIDAFFAI